MTRDEFLTKLREDGRESSFVDLGDGEAAFTVRHAEEIGISRADAEAFSGETGGLWKPVAGTFERSWQHPSQDEDSPDEDMFSVPRSVLYPVPTP